LKTAQWDLQLTWLTTNCMDTDQMECHYLTVFSQTKKSIKIHLHLLSNNIWDSEKT